MVEEGSVGTGFVDVGVKTAALNIAALVNSFYFNHNEPSLPFEPNINNVVRNSSESGGALFDLMTLGEAKALISNQERLTPVFDAKGGRILSPDFFKFNSDSIRFELSELGQANVEEWRRISRIERMGIQEDARKFGIDLSTTIARGCPASKTHPEGNNILSYLLGNVTFVQ